jgi:hypothetical protein
MRLMVRMIESIVKSLQSKQRRNPYIPIREWISVNRSSKASPCMKSIRRNLGKMLTKSVCGAGVDAHLQPTWATTVCQSGQ